MLYAIPLLIGLLLLAYADKKYIAIRDKKEARLWNKIVLQAGTHPKVVEHEIYNHELVHWILFMMNEDSLRTNEKFVDNFAKYLTQYEVTRRYKWNLRYFKIIQTNGDGD